MSTSTISLFYLLMQFMRRNLNFSTLSVLTLMHSFSFTTYCNSSETILRQLTGLVSYALAAMRLRIFGSPSRNNSFDVSLEFICTFFDLNYSCVTHVGMPLITFLITPRVITFFSSLYYDFQKVAKFQVLSILH